MRIATGAIDLCNIAIVDAHLNQSALQVAGELQ